MDRTQRARLHGKYGQSILEEEALSFLAEFWKFLRVRKKFWLLPLLIMTVLFAAMVVMAESSAIAPFIYTLF